MKIGIIVHSVTGNTLKVSKMLEKRLVEEGHEVVLDEIKTAGKVELGAKDADFAHLPDTGGYDLIVFGSHTEAFRLETAMQIYLKKLEDTSGKAICLATHMFPFKWMGGTGTVNTMKSLCEEKGLEVIGTFVVNWSPESKRQAGIEAVVDQIIGLI